MGARELRALYVRAPGGGNKPVPLVPPRVGHNPGEPAMPPASTIAPPPVAHARYAALVSRARREPALRMGIVHPCEPLALAGALDAARAGLIAPVLIGPRTKISAAGAAVSEDLAEYEIVDVPHSHAAAARAVGLVREGRVDALMKGSLHTDELMAEVVRADTGLRTARRISHCFVLDVPGHDGPLIISDAAINIAPTLADKVDIVQNAIDLAHALELAEVRVAILSASETVNPQVPSTIEAAALCKMAERGQITGAAIDGPLALDNAIDPQAAAVKGIASPVAGRANVLIVPDLEAGNMLAKSLTFLAHADAAGIVVGARVPIALTSRADSALARLASCAVAVLVARWRRAAPARAIT